MQRLVQMSTLDVIANILSWWLIESIRVFNFSEWFGHFGARRSSSNRNHEMIFTAQMITEKLRQSLKPETDPESELLPRGDKDCWKTERSLFCSLDFPGCDQRQFSRLSLTPNSSFSVLYSQLVGWYGKGLGRFRHIKLPGKVQGKITVWVEITLYWWRLRSPTLSVRWRQEIESWVG